MKTLNFDFDFANASYFPLESVKAENKEKAIMYYSKLYEKYSDKINKQNGKVLIGYSGDGTKIIAGQVECSTELFIEIYNDEKIIKELSENISF